MVSHRDLGDWESYPSMHYWLWTVYRMLGGPLDGVFLNMVIGSSGLPIMDDPAVADVAHTDYETPVDPEGMAEYAVSYTHLTLPTILLV